MLQSEDRLAAGPGVHREEAAPGNPPRGLQRIPGLITLLLGTIAFLSPLIAEADPEGLAGVLLILSGGIDLVHSFRRRLGPEERSPQVGAAITILMGFLLIHAPFLLGRAILFLLAAWFALDGLRGLVTLVRQVRAGGFRVRDAVFALGNLLVAVVLPQLPGEALRWALVIASGLRILAAAINMLQTPIFSARDSAETVVRDLQLPDDPQILAHSGELEAAERARAPIDRGWVIAFLITLLTIHVGRMESDWNLVGLLSPAVAVVGDIVIAMLLAFGVWIPLRLLVQRLTRGLASRAWRWVIAGEPGPTRGRHLIVPWLTGRMRFAIRMRRARYSTRAALMRGLQTGLPAAAVIAATVPIWGMSWYFDTENWAAGIWDSWAAGRTDEWREAMVRAVATNEMERTGSMPDFTLSPPGVTPAGDFSFLVIGDTGEGDASQHVLRDQFLDAARADDVKFVVVSSDVVYPTGAMKDYEAKFWLPFKGCNKPVYAIPGNHDWYDALEGFAATFLSPEAARTVMRTRVEMDHRLTTTTDSRIESLITEAARLRREYDVPTGFQNATFFQVQTDRFALIAVDTGVLKDIDPVQLDWLRAALVSARGKCILALLGHPLYAGGHYQAAGRDAFAAIHRLLREHGVAVVMAGDTHDLEYYLEPAAEDAAPVHHFVNGGGGAYLSLGTALAWPSSPATQTWAFYPRVTPYVRTDALTPAWKRPLWWWTKRFNAWPFSAEGLAAAFDYNAAPFFQSFVKIEVEPSRKRVRVLPIGVHGRLRWSDLQCSQDLRPAAAGPGNFAEWIVPIP